MKRSLYFFCLLGFSLALAPKITFAAPLATDKNAEDQMKDGTDETDEEEKSQEMEQHHAKMFHKMLQSLNLTADQKTQMRAIHKKYKPQMQEKFQAIKTQMKTMGDMMGQEPLVSEDQAHAQHMQIAKAMSDMADLKFEMQWEMMQILTAAQRKQLHDKMMAGPGFRRRGK